MEVTTYEGPGPGRQQCPRCKLWVDDDIGICQCGYNFTVPNQPEILPEAPEARPPKPKPSKASKKAEKKAANPGWTMRTWNLRIPSGGNPVPLQGTTKAALLKWANAVREYWLTKNYFLMIEGLCYYLQWEPAFDDNEKALDAACKILEDNLSDEAAS